MSDPLSKSSHETTPLTQDHESQENASAQEPPLPYNPPPAYTETKGVPPLNMAPPPEYNETPSSIPHAPTTPTVFVVPINSKPAEATCPYCNVPITTRVEHKAGNLTWYLFQLAFIFIFCCNFTKDVTHFCPICQRRLGRYYRPVSSRILKFACLITSIYVILIICIFVVKAREYNR